MPRSDPTPVWVLQKTRELVARATPAHIIAGIITAAGYPANARQVRRWKEKHGTRQTWRGDDAALDNVVQQLRDDDELGAEEGYRSVQPVVNDAIASWGRPRAARAQASDAGRGCRPERHRGKAAAAAHLCGGLKRAARPHRRRVQADRG